MRDYKNINDYRLASYTKAVYTYSEGDFTYPTFELKNIGYNLTK